MDNAQATHTPGPWELGDLDKNGQRIVRSEHIEICTCWHHCVRSIEREMEGNARLIAAAPDLARELNHAAALLALAADVVRTVDFEGDRFDLLAEAERFDALLAKATGAQA
jgi:hypothetical protein